MTRPLARIGFFALLSAAAFGQATKGPAKLTFQIADVHASAPAGNRNLQGGVLRDGRYELRNATMLDLIKTAYGVDAETVFGGPSWLEWDRFDVVAKAPANTSPANVRLMLQALLADRFKLVVHKDTKPIQGFVLSMGKGKHKLKEADGSGEHGCEPQPLGPPTSASSLPPWVISCRGVTMEEFAPLLRSFAGDYLTGPVLDSTGLKGAWDFDLKLTPKVALSFAGADGITLFEAVDKQLGLKLEPGKVPMPVLVVDNANEKPTPNLPEVKTALPPPPPPEFEVASVRPSPPGTTLGPPATLQPGGVRYEAHGLPLFIMIAQAWQRVNPPGEEIPGTPKWLTLRSPLFDIVAQVPITAIASGTQLYRDDLQAMMRALLVDRFKMVTHYEDRPMDAYTLVAAKPKLKPADPSTRTGCKTGLSAAPRDPGSGPPPIVATCQNVTLAQFAERLQSIAPIYLRYPVLDGTAIQGAWDFTLTFSGIDPNRAGGGRGGTKGGGPAPAAGATDAASDPIGGISLFDAVDKQLGLKLEKHKRPEPVFVIDHIEEKPTDN
jgi:uncharacterized protein (TIGR03435 family)